MDRSPPSVDEAGTSLVRHSVPSILTVVSAAVLITTVSGCHWFSTAGDRGPQGCAALFVTKITPNQGAAAGGTKVTIDGSCFGTGDTADFGSKSAQQTTVNSGHQVTATSPPGSGTVKVTVVTPGGTTSDGTVWFTYQPSAALDPLPIAPLSSMAGRRGRIFGPLI